MRHCKAPRPPRHPSQAQLNRWILTGDSEALILGFPHCPIWASQAVDRIGLRTTRMAGQEVLL